MTPPFPCTPTHISENDLVSLDRLEITIDLGLANLVDLVRSSGANDSRQRMYALQSGSSASPKAGLRGDACTREYRRHEDFKAHEAEWGRMVECCHCNLAPNQVNRTRPPRVGPSVRERMEDSRAKRQRDREESEVPMWSPLDFHDTLMPQPVFDEPFLSDEPTMPAHFPIPFPHTSVFDLNLLEYAKHPRPSEICGLCLDTPIQFAGIHFAPFGDFLDISMHFTNDELDLLNADVLQLEPVRSGRWKTSLGPYGKTPCGWRMLREKGVDFDLRRRKLVAPVPPQSFPDINIPGASSRTSKPPSALHIDVQPLPYERAPAQSERQICTKRRDDPISHHNGLELSHQKKKQDARVASWNRPGTNQHGDYCPIDCYNQAGGYPPSPTRSISPVPQPSGCRTPSPLTSLVSRSSRPAPHPRRVTISSPSFTASHRATVEPEVHPEEFIFPLSYTSTSLASPGTKTAKLRQRPDHPTLKKTYSRVKSRNTGKGNGKEKMYQAYAMDADDFGESIRDDWRDV